MTLRVSAGWNHSVVGSFSMTITGSTGAAFTVTITTGQYAHETMASVLTVYTAFAAALQTAINAAATAGTYTVSYSTTTFAYTITRDSGTFTATLNTLARRILGRTADYTPGAISHTSTVRPYYVIDSTAGARSNVDDDYEPDGLVEVAETDDGQVYSVSRTAAPTYHDFSLEFEPKSAIQAYAADPAKPWTYKHLVQHCRSTEPFLVVDDVGSSVHKFRGESASFKATRLKADYDNHQSIRFNTFLLGRF